MAELGDPIREVDVLPLVVPVPETLPDRADEYDEEPIEASADA